VKEIRAFVQPFLLDKITAALLQLPEFPGMSVSEVRGFGRGMKMSRTHSLQEELEEFTHKLRLEIFVRDEMVAAAVQALCGSAHTGNRGDGKVFVLPVEEAVRVRTGERGDAAIWSDVSDDGDVGGVPPDGGSA
jgi:nitrogen regulatory protein P-II 1